jgi:hypothetical protein
MPGQEVEGATAEEANRESRDPEDQENPDDGPTMTGAGAEPGGNAMDHWNTAKPSTDATKPETMPEALGGTGETQKSDETSNPA